MRSGRAAAELGFQTQTSLREGVAATLEWYRHETMADLLSMGASGLVAHRQGDPGLFGVSTRWSCVLVPASDRWELLIVHVAGALLVVLAGFARLVRYARLSPLVSCFLCLLLLQRDEF